MSRQEVRTIRTVTEYIENSAGGLPEIAGLAASVLTTADAATATTKVTTTATAAEISAACDLSAQEAMAPGSGFAGTGTIYESSVIKEGSLIKTSIIIDLTGAKSSTTDLDIIGNHASNPSHIGQFTAAVNGTYMGGKLTCLEAPTGGVTDIDLYAATEGTGVFDGAVGDLVETALVTSGGAWTLGTSKPLLVDIAANKYLYLTGGAGGTAATYTAGRFLLEIWGV